jgi:hypothetical protein
MLPLKRESARKVIPTSLSPLRLRSRLLPLTARPCLREQAFERALSALSSMSLHFGNAFLSVSSIVRAMMINMIFL